MTQDQIIDGLVDLADQMEDRMISIDPLSCLSVHTKMAFESFNLGMKEAQCMLGSFIGNINILDDEEPGIEEGEEVGETSN